MYNPLIVQDYVLSLENAGFLMDKLSKREYSLNEGNQEYFPCHQSPTELYDGIKCGKLLQGTFLASRDNFLEGSVNIDSMEKLVSIIQINTNCFSVQTKL